VPREAAIEAEGRVMEILSESVSRVEMPNGHRLLAHLSGAMRRNFVRIELGDTVIVEMTPFDMSKGRIVSRKQ
jgi:translation initiation factor IF-1